MNEAAILSSTRKEDVAYLEGKIFLCGGLAGVYTKSIVAPLDRFKIILQTHHQTYIPKGSIFSILPQIYHKEGWRGFYKGNGVQIIRVFPYAALQFLAFEQAKVLFTNKFSNETAMRLASGAFAGCAAVTLTYPLDLLRAKLAYQIRGNEQLPTIKSVLADAYKSNGIRGLYRGYMATLLGVIPYGSVSFFSFEFLKSHCAKHKTFVDDSLRLTISGKLICGGSAGCVAQTVAYPFDIVRRRMQVGNLLNDPKVPPSKTTTIRATLKAVYENHGFSKGLYRGLSINYIRAIPNAALAFSIYELLKQSFGINTGAIAPSKVSSKSSIT